VYDTIAAPAEALGLSAERGRTLAAARGCVVEIGAGTGLNLDHYPATVESIVACEPDPALRRRLQRRADVSSIPATVTASWPPEPATFDTVVSTFALCRTPDLSRTLEDVGRLMAPGGQLLFLEPVLARTAFGSVQRVVAPLWALAFGGCRVDRDMIAALRAARFVVTDCERPTPFGRVSAQTVVRGRAIRRRRGGT
jgi:SAM-dependent methyltransferase